jgi:hypothetical protein
MNQVQVEQKSYQMPPHDGSVAYFLSVAESNYPLDLRKGLRGSHSEQRPAGVHSDRQHVAHCQRWRRSDTRQTNRNAQRPGPRFGQQLCEYPRCRHSSVLRTMAQSRSGVYHRAKGTVRRDVLLHA